MKRVRQLHIWLGVFFAPAILFFAASGAFMTLGLHKDRTNSETTSVIARMAEIHRKQTAFPNAAPKPKLAGEKPATEPTPSDVDATSSDPTSKPAPKPLTASKALFRAFVILMAAGIVVTTLLGLILAFERTKQRTGLLCAFVIGLLLPALLLLI